MHRPCASTEANWPVKSGFRDGRVSCIECMRKVTGDGVSRNTNMAILGEQFQNTRWKKACTAKVPIHADEAALYELLQAKILQYNISKKAMGFELLSRSSMCNRIDVDSKLQSISAGCRRETVILIDYYK